MWRSKQTMRHQVFCVAAKPPRQTHPYRLDTAEDGRGCQRRTPTTKKQPPTRKHQVMDAPYRLDTAKARHQERIGPAQRTQAAEPPGKRSMRRREPTTATHKHAALPAAKAA